jgi:amino acid permease
LIGGSICAIVVVVLVYWSGMIIVRKTNQIYDQDKDSPLLSYHSVVRYHLGNNVSHLVSATLLLYLFGVSIGLFIIVGEWRFFGAFFFLSLKICV